MRDPSNDVESHERHPLFGVIVGSLMFHVGNFSLEASHPTGLLTRHLIHASDVHFKAALHVLHYLRGRVGKAFKTGKNTAKRPARRGLWASVDAAFAGSREKRSCTGFIIYYNSTPIMWVSRKQKSVSLSTTDAETKAATECVKEIIILRRLLAFLGLGQDGPTPMLEDNSAVVTLSEDQGKQNANRLKYMEVRDRFVYECCNRGIVKCWKVPTDKQVSDICTKTLTVPDKFEFLRDLAYNPLPLEEMCRVEEKTDLKKAK